MSCFDVIAGGINVVDNMVVLPEVVRRNEKHAVPHLVVQGGGPGPNQACGLAALGWRTAFLTRHGDNTISRIAEAEFARCGVSLDLVVHSPKARPAVAVVEVDPRSGERTVFFNLDDYEWLSADDVPADAVRRAKLVIADAYEYPAAKRMLELAREARIPSVLDVEAGEAERMRPLVALASHVVLSLEGGRQLTQRSKPADVLAALQAWTYAQLVVSDGVNGAWALHRDGGILHQSAFRVRAVDSTGCGDAFHAAYASALLDGFALPERIEFAAWCAAQVALALGARSNLPTREWVRMADRAALSPTLRMELNRILPAVPAIQP